MAKLKRKHLDALDAKAQQDTQQAPMIDHSVHPVDATSPHSSKRANSVDVDPLAPSSLTSPSYQLQSEQLTQHGTEGSPKVGLSLSSFSCVRGHPVEPDPLSSSLQQTSCDDEASDSSSWVEVRKQRVVIIIPSLPKPELKPLKSRFKSGTGCGGRRDRALLFPYKAKGKVSKNNGHPKGSVTSLNRNSNGKRACKRKNLSAAAQPISGMDILLESALGAVHTLQGESHYKGIRKNTSLAITDSRVEPEESPLKLGGLNISVESKKAHKRTGSHKQELCLMQVSVPDSSSPNIVDREGKVLIYHGRRLPAPSFNEAFRALTLKKQLDKAGGFRKWLCSVGLSRFKDVFEKRIWTEAELLQLSMDDLKRMGKLTVGPRRKFVWAINRLSQQLM